MVNKADTSCNCLLTGMVILLTWNYYIIGDDDSDGGAMFFRKQVIFRVEQAPTPESDKSSLALVNDANSLL